MKQQRKSVVKICFLIFIFLLGFSKMTYAGIDTIPPIGTIIKGEDRSGLIGASKNAGYNASITSSIEITKLAGDYIQYFLSFLGVIFLILIIYGGFIWMQASGNEEETKKAKEIMTDAVIGLVVILAGYAISAYIIGKLAGMTT